MPPTSVDDVNTFVTGGRVIAFIRRAFFRPFVGNCQGRAQFTTDRDRGDEATLSRAENGDDASARRSRFEPLVTSHHLLESAASGHKIGQRLLRAVVLTEPVWRNGRAYDSRSRDSGFGTIAVANCFFSR